MAQSDILVYRNLVYYITPPPPNCNSSLMLATSQATHNAPFACFPFLVMTHPHTHTHPPLLSAL